MLSIRAVNIEAVSKDISRIFLPIIQELEELDEGEGAIDKNEFIYEQKRHFPKPNEALYLWPASKYI